MVCDGKNHFSQPVSLNVLECACFRETFGECVSGCFPYLVPGPYDSKKASGVVLVGNQWPSTV